jgi:hypothetical protein
MQVKIKLGREWWMLPSKNELTEWQFEPFKDVPYVGILQAGESVRFFELQTKERVIEILTLVKKAAEQSMKPTLSRQGGLSIAFVSTRKKVKQS